MLVITTTALVIEATMLVIATTSAVITIFTENPPSLTSSPETPLFKGDSACERLFLSLTYLSHQLSHNTNAASARHNGQAQRRREG